MTSVPDDPTMTPEVRRFLDDQQRAAAKLTSDLTAALASIPALATQAEAEAGTDNVAYLSALRVAQAIAALNPFGSAFIHVRDEKTQNTDGGTFTQGSWVTRTLNTTKTNRISGASLASDKITLPPGRYMSDATVPGNGCNRHQARLFDVTGSAQLIIGTSEHAIVNGALNITNTCSHVRGEFTLAVQSDVRIEHQCNSTKSNDGFGLASNFTTEVYTEVMIWKL